MSATTPRADQLRDLLSRGEGDTVEVNRAFLAQFVKDHDDALELGVAFLKFMPEKHRKLAVAALLERLKEQSQ